jgi:peptidoglycan/LPS O-acetylase OafA/YrhL
LKARLPGLDGLRAISIGMVVTDHIWQTKQFLGNDDNCFRLFVYGDLGVHIFFVISGYLITTIILEGERDHGRIDIKDFYLKRFFRIFPAYYVFLIVVCIFFVSRLNIDSWSIFQAFTYTTGLWPSPAAWAIGHTWSLGVEEQYYLLYPVFLLTVTNVLSRKRAMIILICCFPFLRMALYKFYWPAFSYSILYRGDCILWGCALALYQDKVKIFFVKNKEILYSMISFVAVIMVFLRYSSIRMTLGFLTIPFLTTIQSLFAGLIIVQVSFISRETSFLYRLMNNRPIVYIGILSYSIYLWQQIVIPGGNQMAAVWQVFPFCIPTIMVLSLLSYTCIEAPFLKLGRKIRDHRDAG